MASVGSWYEEEFDYGLKPGVLITSPSNLKKLTELFNIDLAECKPLWVGEVNPHPEIDGWFE